MAYCKVDYPKIKEIIKSKGDKVQKSGNYITIFLDTTKIYGDKQADQYIAILNGLAPNLKILTYINDHMNFDLSKRNIQNMQVRL